MDTRNSSQNGVELHKRTRQGKSHSSYQVRTIHPKLEIPDTFCSTMFRPISPRFWTFSEMASNATMRSTKTKYVKFHFIWSPENFVLSILFWWMLPPHCPLSSLPAIAVCGTKPRDWNLVADLPRLQRDSDNVLRSRDRRCHQQMRLRRPDLRRVHSAKPIHNRQRPSLQVLFAGSDSKQGFRVHVSSTGNTPRASTSPQWTHTSFVVLALVRIDIPGWHPPFSLHRFMRPDRAALPGTWVAAKRESQSFREACSCIGHWFVCVERTPVNKCPMNRLVFILCSVQLYTANTTVSTRSRNLKPNLRLLPRLRRHPVPCACSSSWRDLYMKRCWTERFVQTRQLNSSIFQKFASTLQDCFAGSSRTVMLYNASAQC